MVCRIKRRACASLVYFAFTSRVTCVILSRLLCFFTVLVSSPNKLTSSHKRGRCFPLTLKPSGHSLEFPVANPEAKFNRNDDNVQPYFYQFQIGYYSHKYLFDLLIFISFVPGQNMIQKTRADVHASRNSIP
jgi:hypothetical protein